MSTGCPAIADATAPTEILIQMMKAANHPAQVRRTAGHRRRDRAKVAALDLGHVLGGNRAGLAHGAQHDRGLACRLPRRRFPGVGAPVRDRGAARLRHGHPGTVSSGDLHRRPAAGHFCPVRGRGDRGGVLGLRRHWRCPRIPAWSYLAPGEGLHRANSPSAISSAGRRAGRRAPQASPAPRIFRGTCRRLGREVPGTTGRGRHDRRRRAKPDDFGSAAAAHAAPPDTAPSRRRPGRSNRGFAEVRSLPPSSDPGIPPNSHAVPAVRAAENREHDRRDGWHRTKPNQPPVARHGRLTRHGDGLPDVTRFAGRPLPAPAWRARQDDPVHRRRASARPAARKPIPSSRNRRQAPPVFAVPARSRHIRESLDRHSLHRYGVRAADGALPTIAISPLPCDAQHDFSSARRIADGVSNLGDSAARNAASPAKSMA